MGNVALPGNLLRVDQREQLLLAPYATFSAASGGRKYEESEHPYRSPFQRDRDRIVHSSAFRRLSGKMQVFTGQMGDYHRTRLTHTHEVASIARTLGRALRLNEDLVEALALLHDIGHPPYGHAGEETLCQCLEGQGGFSHNQHALTIAEELEQRYPPRPGLNLTREVLAGQAHRAHSTPAEPSPSDSAMAVCLEVQVVDVADSITYDAHDADDAVKLGLVTLDQLMQLPLIARLHQQVGHRYGDLTPSRLRKAIVHELIDCQVSSIVQGTAEALAEADFGSVACLRQAGFQIQLDADLASAKRELEDYLYAHVYRHPRLLEMRHQAQERIGRLFDRYCRRPQLLPGRHAARINRVGTERAVVEYLAGMTDRFCDQRCRELGILRVEG